MIRRYMTVTTHCDDFRAALADRGEGQGPTARRPHRRSHRGHLEGVHGDARRRAEGLEGEVDDEHGRRVGEEGHVLGAREEDVERRAARAERGREDRAPEDGAEEAGDDEKGRVVVRRRVARAVVDEGHDRFVEAVEDEEGADVDEPRPDDRDPRPPRQVGHAGPVPVEVAVQRVRQAHAARARLGRPGTAEGVRDSDAERDRREDADEEPPQHLRPHDAELRVHARVPTDRLHGQAAARPQPLAERLGGPLGRRGDRGGQDPWVPHEVRAQDRRVHDEHRRATGEHRQLTQDARRDRHRFVQQSTRSSTGASASTTSSTRRRT